MVIMGIWVSNLVVIPKTTLFLVFTVNAKNKKIFSSVRGGHITFNKVLLQQKMTPIIFPNVYLGVTFVACGRFNIKKKSLVIISIFIYVSYSHCAFQGQHLQLSFSPYSQHIT
jgi:hypothetical protein